MPRQNRVTPFGDLVATPERGTFMGNRGLLHDDVGRVRRGWRLRRWIVCRLEFRGRKREVMAPGRYTELFFLDEATALAAGHRPCAECRRDRYLAYRDAWASGSPGPATALAIDDRLHRERLGPGRVWSAPLDGLPDGTFVTTADAPDVARLVLGGALRAWSHGGYGPARRAPRGVEVRVLTPRSTVAAMTAGYAPEVHPSAGPGS